ncbi:MULTISPECIES: hypothetical protein [Subtercola]|uniref:Uncharacterized protein n=1 Tax=Subtercola vilae TaxID=2056433 RepID=A0A4T2C4G7_9MICO|nr:MULTISPECIES: hypothetical protein [Subtercola]MEA9984772.1 hypothetical protein [Subtercola sp. RTI3]TIH38997.1 hypothetical protein D4765_05375 [Subtercola vilae]
MTFGRFVNSLFGAPSPTAIVAPGDGLPAEESGLAAGALAEYEQSEDGQTARALAELRNSVRRAGRELPTVLSSRLGQIGDLLQNLTLTIASQGASTEQRVLLEAMVRDYIPTPLHAFLALPEGDRADGSDATRLFAEQLGLLEETVRDMLNQVRIGAIEELSTHGRFLADKFQAPDAGLTLGGR